MKKVLNINYCLLAMMTLLITLVGTPIYADNAVKLKVLVIAIGDETQDPGLAYIKPALDEMGVPYEVMNAVTQDLTSDTLAAVNGVACGALDNGCVGNFNGIILTDSDLVPEFTPAEWEMLHNYEKDFKVREAVLSGWPAKYWDPNSPFGVYLDYGLTYTFSGNNFNGQWSIPTSFQKEVFEYINKVNFLPVTDFAFAAVPSPPPSELNPGPRDGTVPVVTPLLKTGNGEETLVSIVQYMAPSQTAPVREVLISTITNASFLIHSNVLAYEFINWATQGVFVGSRFIHMTAHLDDLFLENTLWDPSLKRDNPSQTYRLNSADISNAVSKQSAFHAAHPTAKSFKLDFAFNGSGAVVNPEAAVLVPNLAEDLVEAVIANKTAFRFINHTFTHADMDSPPIPATAPCDYSTFTTVAAIQAEITKNRTVWGMLGLPEQSANNKVLVTGNHSGLKDRKCTDDPAQHLDMLDVQSDDVPFDDGANPLFFTAAANAGVTYLASDASQLNQNIEQYVSGVEDGKSTDRLLLPRWPTNVFYNTINPIQLVDEYNYIFHDRFVNASLDPCNIPGAICTTRDYSQILIAEAESALRHMLTFKKWPHFFHQGNVAKYDTNGNTLQFDWLNSVFTEYERLIKLPVKSFPYHQIGDKTKDRLNAKSAIIQAIWNRTNNTVSVSANKAVPNLEITGLAGGELYGGQLIRAVTVNTQPVTFTVNRALAQ